MGFAEKDARPGDGEERARERDHVAMRPFSREKRRRRRLRARWWVCVKMADLAAGPFSLRIAVDKKKKKRK